MDLRQLEALDAVDRTGSYQRAAAELHITQPALWRQVRSLEVELRVPLFARVGRGVRITAAGAELALAAREVIAQARRFGTTAAALEAGRRGRVRVACMAPHVTRVLAPAIGRLRTVEPDIEVALLEFTAGQSSGSPDFDGLLAAGDADLAIGIPRQRSARRKLYDAEIVVGVADDHPWRLRETIDVRALRGEPLLVSPAGWLSRTQLDAASLAAGFEIDVAFESGNASTLVALARAGAGIVVVADDAGQPYTATWPRLTARRRVLSSPVEIYWLPGRPLAPAAETVVGTITETAAELE